MEILTPLKRIIVRILLTLPDKWKLKIVGGERLQIQGNLLDLDLHLLGKLAQWGPQMEEYSPKKARGLYEQSIRILSRNPIQLAQVETTVIGDMDDAIKIRIYNPDPTRSNLPILVYLHGGGFVLGNIDTVDSICRHIAHRTPCLVFSVDYRLAPEYPFPLPLDDAYRAYLWVTTHAYRLGGNPDNVAIAGDSAGANLALGVAMKLRDNSITPPNFLGLLYPVADMSQESQSYELFGEGFFLTRKAMQWCTHHYLPPTTDRKNPLLSPIYYEGFSGFPPTYLATAGYDVLNEDGKRLAAKLRASQVSLVHSDFPHLAHGYLNLAEIIPSCLEGLEDFIKFLKTQWSHLKEEDSETR